jgi:hypothetical protein
VSQHGKLPGDVCLKRGKAGDCRELYDEKFMKLFYNKYYFGEQIQC